MTGSQPPTKETFTDVLVIGAGPAGLMASLSLSSLGIDHKIIDQRGTRALNGRADGFHPRTMEIWDSFGIAEKLVKYGCPYGEFGLWGPKENNPGEICRLQRQKVLGYETCRFYGVLLHQGYIEAILVEAAKKRGARDVYRGAKPTALTISESDATYPVTVHVQNLFEKDLEQWRVNAHSIQPDGTIKTEPGWVHAHGADPGDHIPRVSGVPGTNEVIHAKYVIGADGAHSWTRRQLPGFELEGKSTNQVWGCIDIVPISDWPDMRKTCTVTSQHGTVIVIPREADLVRLYIQFPEEEDNKQNSYTLDDVSSATKMMDAARKVFHPYKLEYRYCDWWALYKVGQRVGNHFSHENRVFLAGDSVHTHTPKGGYGMNVSMQDTYNLSWKLAGVLNGQLPSSVLSTYEPERKPIAQDLIDIDTALSAALSSRSSVPHTELAKIYQRLGNYSSGSNHSYPPNALVTSLDLARPDVTTELKLGMKFFDATVFRHANAFPVSAQSLLVSDGLWGLTIFAGDVSTATGITRINSLGDRIAALNQRYPSISKGTSGFARILLFHASRTSDIEITAFHPTFRPLDEIKGHDYNIIYGDRPSPISLDNGKPAHKVFGIDPQEGAIVLVRPDQIVSWIGGLQDLDRLEAWLDTFMSRVNHGVNGKI